MNSNTTKSFIRLLIIPVFLVSLLTQVHAQTKWELKKHEDGIKVYAGSVPNSNIKAIKLECTIDATIPQLTALLLDAKAHERWVYSTETSYEVKKIDDNHVIYYSAMSMPWPVKNRDIVVDLKLTLNPNTKVLTVNGAAIPGHVAVKKDVIRVTSSKVLWTVTPISAKQLKIEYIAQADPGGSIPAWVVNMFCTKGPFETFKRLRETVSLPEYREPAVSYK